MLRWVELENVILKALDGETFHGVTLTEDRNLFFGGAEQSQLSQLEDYVVVRFEGSTPEVHVAANIQSGGEVLMGVIVASQDRLVLRSMVTEMHYALEALRLSVEALPEGKSGEQHYAVGLAVSP